MKKNMQGFTLIELMIVIAIIAILVAIALPAYQNYTIRAKNSECISIAASPKLAISETLQSTPTWPANWAAAGYVAGTTTYCGTPTLTGTGFTIASTANTGGPITFTFTANTTNPSAIQWTCSSGAGANKSHVPSSCRAN